MKLLAPATLITITISASMTAVTALPIFHYPRAWWVPPSTFRTISVEKPSTKTTENMGGMKGPGTLDWEKTWK